MTKQQYADTQTYPKRIVGTTQGKDWVKHFLAYCRLRMEAEHRVPAEDYENNLAWQFSDAHTLFTKYLMEALDDENIKHNAMVMTIVYTHHDGRWYQWQNYVGDDLFIAKCTRAVLENRYKNIKKVCRELRVRKSWLVNVLIAIKVDGGLRGYISARLPRWWPPRLWPSL